MSDNTTKQDIEERNRRESMALAIINQHQSHLHTKTMQRATSWLGISSFIMGISFYQLNLVTHNVFLALIILGIGLYTVSQSLTLLYTLDNKKKLKSKLVQRNYQRSDLDNLPIEENEKKYTVRIMHTEQETN